MLSLQLIRESPKVVRESQRKRGEDMAIVEEVLALDGQWRTTLREVEELRAQRRAAGKEIANAGPQERQERIEALRQASEHIDALEGRLKEIQERLDALLLQLPNIPSPKVPEGDGEGDNVVVRQEGGIRELDFPPRPHWELGEALGIIDFERGVKLSGSRFYVLTGAGARLQRALIAFMLDLHTDKHGYKEVYPPFVVKQECFLAAGQLPKFADNIYHDVEDDVWLVTTAEVPLTNLHRDEILEPGTLPLRYVAYTPCFRREKMSAGRDVRGLKRGHQFDKVELYKLCQPEDSGAELETMVQDAQDVLRALEIPHRVVQLCTGDLGFAAALSFDLEVWAPGCGEWLEVSSLSSCTDFQARRANIRFRREKGARPEFVHTLNGSGLALPRTLIALLESYQQADGAIIVPEALRPYMWGLDVIRPP
ncbi:MAG TPA: serine--tRNA ligase [Dehalococcoidia bacterium]|nr:serine--tRNA ligase [Dehalococcoidia bacterium]